MQVPSTLGIIAGAASKGASIMANNYSGTDTGGYGNITYGGSSIAGSSTGGATTWSNIGSNAPSMGYNYF
jgi:hypothetical protein